MNFANTDLNLLRIFDAIYSQGTLTRAGDLLFITQPAVSHALCRLRAVYNDPLFVRTAKGMKPTPLACEIAPDIRDALQHVRVTMARADGFQPETSTRHFRFGMVDMIETFVVPRLLTSIQHQAPRVTLEIFQSSRRDMLRGLLGLDLDFVIDNSMPQHVQVERCEFYKDDFVAAVRPGHPVIGSPLTLEKYLAHRHVHVSSKRSAHSHVDAALSTVGARREIVVQTPYYLDAPHIISSTDFILTTSRCIAKRAGLHVMELPFRIAPLTVWIYWPTLGTEDPAMKWMRGQLLGLNQAGAGHAAGKDRRGSGTVGREEIATAAEARASRGQQNVLSPARANPTPGRALGGRTRV